MTVNSNPAEIMRFTMTGEDRIEQKSVLARNSSVMASHAQDRREAYRALCSLTPLAPGVGFLEINEPGAKGWWAIPNGEDHARAILYIHGGGYHFGDAESYRGLMSQIATRTGIPVFGVDYPLVPDETFPVAHETIIRARDWLIRQGIDSYALMGDSAGGGLALVLASDSKAAIAPTACVTFSPWTDLTMSGVSFNDPETHDPIFRTEFITALALAYLDGADATDQRASPLFGVSAGMPPLLIQVGTSELLLDDSTRLAHRAAAKGVPVTLQLFEELHHVFQRDAVALAMADRALDLTATFISLHIDYS